MLAVVLVDPDVDEDQRMSMRIDELPGPQPAGPDGRVGGWETKDQSLCPKEVLGKLHSFPMTDQV